MNVLPLLETDFGELLRGAEKGRMPEVKFTERATVCKYAVPDGYPTNPEAGAEITLDIDEDDEDTLVFYASVDARDGKLYTTTSRAVAVVGLGDDITTAEERAEDALAGLGDGLRVRHDIGKPELVQRRIDHMEDLR
jgi:phosphoribosylamine--glycine ligase